MQEIIDYTNNKLNETYSEHKKKAMNVIKNYIISHNLILYGNLAIKEYLKDKIEIDEVDSYYQCISLNGRKNIAEIITILRELEYANFNTSILHLPFGIKCIIAFNEFEKKLPILEVLHVNKYEYYRIKATIEGKQLKIIHPLLLKINLLNDLIDPLNYYNNWKDSYNKLLLLDEYCDELKWSNKNIKTKRKPIAKEKELIDLLVANGVIFTGDFVYNLYQKCVKKPWLRLNKISVISFDSNKLVDKIKKKLGNNISIKTFDNKVSFIDKKISVYYNKHNILDIFEVPNACVSYIDYNYRNKKIKVANYFMLLKYYYGHLWENMSTKKVDNSYIAHIKGMIKNLISARETYLRDKKLLGIASSKGNQLFMIFGLKCDYLTENYTNMQYHNMKIWEYKKTHTEEEYRKAKKICEPI